MHRVSVRAQCHSFIVLALQHLDLGGRAQSQSFQKFKELPVFLINAKNFRVFVRPQIRQQYRTLASQLGDPTAHWHTVRACFFVGKPLEQERLDFRRNPMLKPLRFVVRLCPGKTDHFRKQHFRQLVSQCQPLGYHPPFARQINSSAAIYANHRVAGHPLQRRSRLQAASTFNSSASRALMGVWSSSSISQMALR